MSKCLTLIKDFTARNFKFDVFKTAKMEIVHYNLHTASRQCERDEIFNGFRIFCLIFLTIGCLI